MIQLKSYNAIITDLRLSDAEVKEGLAKIKEARRTQTECAIIVITGHGESGTREKVINLGAKIYLEKPVEPGKIKNLLHSIGVLKK